MLVYAVVCFSNSSSGLTGLLLSLIPSVLQRQLFRTSLRTFRLTNVVTQSTICTSRQLMADLERSLFMSLGMCQSTFSLSAVTNMFRAPESAPVKAKMLYAGSKDACTRAFEGVATKVQATDHSELTEDILADACRRFA